MYIFKSHSSNNRIVKSCLLLMVVCGATVLLFILGMRVIQSQRFLAKDAQCRGNLSQLLLAFHNYHQDYGSYPPACIKSENGERMHSWRVLLLPYIDHPDIYKRYDFDEPWNSPYNSKIAESIPAWLFGNFRSPADIDADSDWTSYLAIVDKGEKMIISHSNSKEGSKIFLVEVHNSGIHWMEPRDISVDQALSRLGKLSERQKSINFITTDGQIGTLSSNSIKFRGTRTELLRKWLPILNSDLEEKTSKPDESGQ